MSPPAPDRERFLKLIEQNEKRLLRVCRVYAASREEREDLFQEIVLQAWRALPAFRGDASEDTWIFRVALNVAMKGAARARKSAARQLPLDGISFRYEGDAAAAGADLAERVERLYACIGRLDPVDRSIMLLYLEELPHERIASVLGISANHVGVKIHRIKKRLLSCMESGS